MIALKKWLHSHQGVQTIKLRKSLWIAFVIFSFFYWSETYAYYPQQHYQQQQRAPSYGNPNQCFQRLNPAQALRQKYLSKKSKVDSIKRKKVSKENKIKSIRTTATKKLTKEKCFFPVGSEINDKENALTLNSLLGDEKKSKSCLRDRKTRYSLSCVINKYDRASKKEGVDFFEAYSTADKIDSTSTEGRIAKLVQSSTGDKDCGEIIDKAWQKIAEVNEDLDKIEGNLADAESDFEEVEEHWEEYAEYGDSSVLDNYQGDDCVDCLRKPSGGEVASGVINGVLQTWLGVEVYNSANRQNSLAKSQWKDSLAYNRDLGIPTPPGAQFYPTHNAAALGFPHAVNGIYGIATAGMPGGGFGCTPPGAGPGGMWGQQQGAGGYFIGPNGYPTPVPHGYGGSPHYSAYNQQGFPGAGGGMYGGGFPGAGGGGYFIGQNGSPYGGAGYGSPYGGAGYGSPYGGGFGGGGFGGGGYGSPYGGGFGGGGFGGGGYGSPYGGGFGGGGFGGGGFGGGGFGGNSAYAQQQSIAYQFQQQQLQAQIENQRRQLEYQVQYQQESQRRAQIASSLQQEMRILQIQLNELVNSPINVGSSFSSYSSSSSSIGFSNNRGNTRNRISPTSNSRTGRTPLDQSDQ